MKIFARIENAKNILLNLKKGEEPVFRFRRGGMIIDAINFTQGGPGERENQGGRAKPLAMASMRLLVNGKAVDIPVIYGNTPFGALKNTVTEVLFEYYRENRPEILDHIYDIDVIEKEYGEDMRELEEAEKYIKENGGMLPDWVSVIAASLFRMKPPFLGVAYTSSKKLEGLLRNTARVVWLNPMFKFWGIGISTWGPSRSIVSSIGLPVIEEFVYMKKEAERLKEGVAREIPSVADEVTIQPISLENLPYDEIPEIDTEDRKKVRGINMFELVKLRKDLLYDYRALGCKVTEKMRKLPAKSKDKNKKNENENDVLTPTPVRLISTGPMTLVSIFAPGTRTGRHTLFEIASFATALENLSKLGANDNVMRIYGYFEFENILTGKKLRLAVATGFGDHEENATVKALSRLFIERMGKVPYHEVLTPLAVALLAVHLYETRKKSEKSGK